MTSFSGSPSPNDQLKESVENEVSSILNPRDSGFNGEGPAQEKRPDAFAKVGLQKMVSAFQGRRFQVSEVRSVAKASGSSYRDDRSWEMLKMTSGTSFSEMSQETVENVARTVAEFFSLNPGRIWRLLPPSRFRWALSLRHGRLWAVGVQTNVLRAGAFLLEEVDLGQRNSPDGAKALAEAVKAKRQSIAVYPRLREGFDRQFILSETAGKPADPE